VYAIFKYHYFLLCVVRCLAHQLHADAQDRKQLQLIAWRPGWLQPGHAFRFSVKLPVSFSLASAGRARSALTFNVYPMDTYSKGENDMPSFSLTVKLPTFKPHRPCQKNGTPVVLRWLVPNGRVPPPCLAACNPGEHNAKCLPGLFWIKGGLGGSDGKEDGEE